jgi:hypothetical protein
MLRERNDKQTAARRSCTSGRRLPGGSEHHRREKYASYSAGVFSKSSEFMCPEEEEGKGQTKQCLTSLEL